MSSAPVRQLTTHALGGGMSKPESWTHLAVLNLKAGEWVEIRTQEEILATLDEQGRLENLPFMPEMLRYCGQRFRVFKRADKSCDNIEAWSIRRMERSVFLEGLRCDGAGHGGCQAGCLIFWKEAWLKRAGSSAGLIVISPQETLVPADSHPRCTVERVRAASQVAGAEAPPIYSCQATEVRNFTSYLKIWDPRQYIRDVRSGNLTSGLASESRGQRALELVLVVLRLLHALAITVFNEVQARRHGTPYPVIPGALEKTPLEKLDLQPGELVQVRSKEEIIATLDSENRNRGLVFDSEMLPYCGGIYRVLRRVHRIIDEKTGKMIDMKYPCIVLEGVVCQSDFHRLCPRAIYSYWRESWLRRASQEFLPSQPGHQVEESYQEAENCQRR
jgi:predicted DNA-binding antitoxin AbrB/MazE fold protein